jgi:YbgC/YbaW family acyl-CoA thioester hydrolase
MSRIKIQLPEGFSFTCSIPVRITDVNYGGHVGNDRVLSIIHEARIQYLESIGYSEMNLAGVGTIMSDVAIEFKQESFYGDTLHVSVAAGEITRIGFELFYKLETEQGNTRKFIAAAKTGLVCFDYERKKIVSIPDAAIKKMKQVG